MDEQAMSTETVEVCHYCLEPNEDMRPYGPGGSKVCYDCATATPEREQETSLNFIALLEATAATVSSGTKVVLIGDGQMTGMSLEQAMEYLVQDLAGGDVDE
jgi:hypothetical protein